MAKPQKTSTTPFLLIGAGLLLMLAAVIWILTGKNNPTSPAAQASLPAQAELPFPEVTRISLADAKAAFDSGAAVFLDVRENDSYQSSHIPGALNIELAQLPAQLSKLDPAKSIITYCT